MGLDDLNDLSLGEAFRKHVLGHREVADLGQRLMQQRDSHSTVFVEGQTPGPYVDFHWPLRATAESIAFQFVRPVIFVDARLPEPSELEVGASRALADRIRLLVDSFASGEIIAVGTFAATGVEGPIGAGQWTRQDLSIDVENSALCETRNHRPAPLWTGIRVRLPDSRPPTVQAAVTQTLPNEPTKARKQIETKSRSRRECVDWLSSLMSNPSVQPCSNDELWAKAKMKWPDKLSRRELIRCRAEVLDTLDEDQRYQWERPGPKSRSPQL